MRNYSREEAAALAMAQKQPVHRGPAQYAGGDWWPSEFERRADEMERMIPRLRLAAAALRREIAADPLTGPGVSA